jgi:hypothetical protein
MTRTDAHRPSAIEPADYHFVGFEVLKIEDIGDAHFLMAERARIRADMERTGGTYSRHQHGGNCHICGAHAIYTALFHHKPSNAYVRTGLECADKLDCSGVEAFRRDVKTALEARAGKRKALAVLTAAGLVGAWEVCEAEQRRSAEYRIACDAWSAANPEPEYRSTDRGYGMEPVGAPKWTPARREESTVCDIVGKLVKYGSISDAQTNYLRRLVDQIARRPQIEAQRAAEQEAAAPVPATTGRVEIVGEVLSIRLPSEDDFYQQTKLLVRHADGWKVWTSCPASIVGDVAKGNKIKFSATLKVSDKDPKFAFASRPSKAAILAA